MPKLALVGDTFAVRLRNRSYGACRIVWTRHDWGHTSVVALDWLGRSVPALQDVRLAPMLELTHPGYAGPCWVRILKGLRVPESYVELGNVAPSAEELSLPLGDDWRDPRHVHRSSVWKAVDHTLYREHRFRADAKYRAELGTRPQPGDVYAVPVGTSWGVAQVLAVWGRVDEDSLATSYIITGSSEIHAEAPVFAEARAGLGSRGLVSVTDLPPEGARKLGNAPLAAAVPDRVNTLGGWRSALPRPPVGERAAAPAAPEPPRAGTPLTLESIEPRKLFPHWRGKVTPEELSTARRIVGRLVTTLRRAKSPANAERAIVAAIQALNEADTFIETVEREDLSDVLVALGRSAGLAPEAVVSLVDREREW